MTERVTFMGTRGIGLVGNLIRGTSKAIVVMAHGFCNDKSSQGRFDRLGDALADVGYASLAFDFGGCGESEDVPLIPGGLLDDLRAAIAYAKNSGFTSVMLFGNSLGAKICLRAHDPDVASMVLVGAGTDATTYDWATLHSVEQMRELGERGAITVREESKWRNNVIVSKEMFDDFAAVDQRALLSAIAEPALLIYGGSREDKEEATLLAAARHGLRHLPSGSRIEVVEDARHGIRDRWDDVVALTLDWIAERTPRVTPTTGR